jgi:hypothetical protein
MCNRTSINQFILPLDRVDATAAGATSAAGVGKARACAGIAVQMLRLGAMLLAASTGAAAMYI